MSRYDDVTIQSFEPVSFFASFIHYLFYCIFFPDHYCIFRVFYCNWPKALFFNFYFFKVGQFKQMQKQNAEPALKQDYLNILFSRKIKIAKK